VSALHFNRLRTRLLAVIMVGACLGMFVITMGILSDNISASVLFEDEESTKELLRSLAIDKDIAYASLEKPDSTFSVSEYFFTDNKQPLWQRSKARTYKVYTNDVYVGDESIAKLHIFSSGKSLHKQIVKTVLFSFFTAIGVALFIYIISLRLQRAITAPIESLNQTSKQVTQNGDYTLRSNITRSDEIGDLARGFNRMLDQIEQRDLKLEKTVQQRTAELERLADEFRHRAFHDSLTGLPNRALAVERFPSLIAHARRTSLPFAVFLIDLDNFKNINDTLGHDIGDQLLQSVSNRLLNNLRQEDIICRLGGDEFMVIAENLKGESPVDSIARKLLECTKEKINIDGKLLDITMSMGGALYPQHGSDLTSLKCAADIAMYAAKEAGKNQFKVFESSMETTTKQRLMVQNDLRSALENRHMRLYYQPQVDAHTQTVYGCEVLIRWQHEQYGLLYPDVFIPYAEESGLVQIIDYYVLEEACRQAKEWLDQNQTLVVSINLSGLHFHNHHIVERLEYALSKYELPAKYFAVELTEAVLISDAGTATQVVNAIKALGIKLSLDDFGVGYSSLNYLRTLPFDTVKLDKSFIAGILTNQQDQRLTEGIVELAARLHLHVVAEGVEDQEQVEYLNRIGCRYMQGYYFLPPRPQHEFENWLSNWKTKHHNT